MKWLCRYFYTNFSNIFIKFVCKFFDKYCHFSKNQKDLFLFKHYTERKSKACKKKNESEVIFLSCMVLSKLFYCFSRYFFQPEMFVSIAKASNSTFGNVFKLVWQTQDFRIKFELLLPFRLV